jgi:hypothetical protein
VTEGNAPLDLSDEVTLYRIVGLNEAKDIEESGGFRFHSAAFEKGKWFATTFEDAVRWGYRMPPISQPRFFCIASVRIATTLLTRFGFFPRLDGIGPAYFVRYDQLEELNATGTVRLDPEIFEKDPLHERLD